MLSHLNLQIASLLLSFHKLGNGGPGKLSHFSRSQGHWVGKPWFRPRGDQSKTLPFHFASYPRMQKRSWNENIVTLGSYDYFYVMSLKGLKKWLGTDRYCSKLDSAAGASMFFNPPVWTWYPLCVPHILWIYF